MEIMLLIDTCTDYNIAKDNKIGYIQTYLTHDHVNIEYITYIYGFVEALTEYRARFGNRDIEPRVLMLDLSTMIIDNIITIYEIHDVPMEAYASADASAYASADASAEDTLYCGNPEEASLDCDLSIIPSYDDTASEVGDVSDVGYEDYDDY
jgi:hypothetical protein